MDLVSAAEIVDGRLLGRNAYFNGVSIDSRTLLPQQLFVALCGTRFDGHHFVQQAFNAGAVGAVTQQKINHCNQSSIILVPSTTSALVTLGHYQRTQFDIPMIAITGSCGKTTTRAIVVSILEQVGSVLSSQKSFNNQIGVPLTLLELKSQHDYAVLELGTNQKGEIAYLTQVVQPTIAVVTNVGAAHLSGLKSMPNIAKEKGCLYRGLSNYGTAIINQDDVFSDSWRRSVKKTQQLLCFSMKEPADVSATDVRLHKKGYPVFYLTLPNKKTVFIQLPLLGVHNVYNALAAATIAVALGVSANIIKKGIESVVPVDRRMNIYTGYKDASIIDDSYNANPSSVSAAIAFLTRRPDAILVLGDMLELGEQASQLHQQIGKEALEAGISQLYCYGPLSQRTAQAFGKNAYHFKDKKILLAALKQKLNDRTTVLVKGSCGMHMNDIVEYLIKKG